MEEFEKKRIEEYFKDKRGKKKMDIRFNVTITTTTNTDNFSGVQMDINDNWVLIAAGDKWIAYPVCNVIRVNYSVVK